MAKDTLRIEEGVELRTERILANALLVGVPPILCFIWGLATGQRLAATGVIAIGYTLLFFSLIIVMIYDSICLYRREYRVWDDDCPGSSIDVSIAQHLRRSWYCVCAMASMLVISLAILAIQTSFN